MKKIEKILTTNINYDEIVYLLKKFKYYNPKHFGIILSDSFIRAEFEEYLILGKEQNTIFDIILKMSRYDKGIEEIKAKYFTVDNYGKLETIIILQNSFALDTIFKDLNNSAFCLN